MRQAKRFAPVALAMGLVCFGCGDNIDSPRDPDPDPGNNPDRVLTSLSVSPPTALLAVGEEATLEVSARYDDGSTAAVTTGLEWSTSSASTVSVDAGKVKGVALGTATIIVKKDGKEARADVTTGVYTFTDRVGPGLSFAYFGGSTTDLSVDTSSPAHGGKASIALKVPATGYAGGAFRAAAPVDLSSFDAVTFWARASRDAVLDKVGIGNSIASTTYQVEIKDLALTPTWQRFVIPLPVPSLLNAESGLFHIAEGDGGGAYTIWLDDIRYETLGAELGTPEPSIADESFARQVDDSLTVNGVTIVYKLGDTTRIVLPSPRYFTFSSSDTNVASVDEAGRVKAVAIGSATITARLGKLDAAGSLKLTVSAITAPSVGATAPVALPTDVISIFSDTYTSVPVQTFCNPDWSVGAVADFDLGADHIKKYSNLAYAGVEFFQPAPLDVTAMTHFHIDVWSPDATIFRVKLVDFGANGVWNGPNSDDAEHELAFDATTTPALTPGAWVSLDLPLSSFTNLTTRGHLAQLVVGTSTRGTVYVDNVYFHKAIVP